VRSLALCGAGMRDSGGALYTRHLRRLAEMFTQSSDIFRDAVRKNDWRAEIIVSSRLMPRGAHKVIEHPANEQARPARRRKVAGPQTQLGSTSSTPEYFIQTRPAPPQDPAPDLLRF